MAAAVLTISSKNYGAWALRGWLMARLCGLEFTEHVIPPERLKVPRLLRDTAPTSAGEPLEITGGHATAQVPVHWLDEEVSFEYE